MASTYEPIATTTLGSTSSTVTFSSIAASWTDLILICSAADAGGGTMRIKFNNDSTNTYSYQFWYADGSSTIAAANSNDNSFALISSNTATYRNLVRVNIPSYSSTTLAKSFVTHTATDQNGSGRMSMYSGSWRSTAAINRIDITTNGTGFVSGGTFTLYGIKAA